MDVGVRNGSTIDEAIRTLKSGGLVIVVDDASRENEGDFVVAAEFATTAAINTMITEGRGLVCVAAAGGIVERLKLPQMVESNGDAHGTAFTVSVDAIATSTGISAADRALTVRAIADPATAPGDLRRPGHVFPLRAVSGGVRSRRGHTEASVELAGLAGLSPAAAICEILDETGAAAGHRHLADLADRLGIPLVTVADLVAHVEEADAPAAARLPTRHGVFTAIGHRDEAGTEHLALVMGDLAVAEDPLVRVHSECLTGDVLGSWRCDCGDQLDLALARIAEAGVGAVLYVRGHEGRGIGLVEKIRAYALQDTGRDTVEANVMLGHPVDARDFTPAAQMLRALGAARVRLLSNNPAKQHALERLGIGVTGLVPLHAPVRDDNARYLDTKRRLLGHRSPDSDSDSRGGDRVQRHLEPAPVGGSFLGRICAEHRVNGATA